ncbi:MAG: WG repeat-containing protein [Candidatus Brocadiia bacterium]
MKRAHLLILCAFIAFVAGCGENEGPAVAATKTVMLCPAAFGPRGGGCAVIDRSNRIVLNLPYDGAAPVGDFYVVCKGGMMGLVRKDGSKVVDCEYPELTVGKNLCRPGDKWHVSVLNEQSGGDYIVGLTYGKPGRGPFKRVMSMDGKQILSDEYSFSQGLGDGFFAAVRLSDQKNRVFDMTGKDVLGAGFEYIKYDPQTPLVILMADGKYTLCDLQMKPIPGILADKVGWYREGMLAVKIGKRWGFVDETGTLVIEPKFTYAGDFSEGLCVAGAALLPDGTVDMTDRPDDQMPLLGYIDKTGCFVIRPQYTAAGRFVNGITGVSTTPRGMHIQIFFHIDKTGQPVKDDDERIATKKEITKGVFLDSKTRTLESPVGNTIAVGVDGYTVSESGAVFFQRDKLWGVLFPGGVVHQPQYLEVKSWSRDCICVRTDRGVKLLDQAGKMVGEEYFSVESLREGRAVFRPLRPTLAGYLDEKGNVAIKPSFTDAGSFLDGRAPACEASWGFIDTAGHWIIQPKYAQVMPFEDGLAPVMLDGLWGVIDTEGKLVIPCRYQNPARFSNGLAVVNVATKWGCVDETGRVVIGPNFDSIRPFKDGIAIAQDGKLFGAIDGTGSWVIPAQYARLDALGEGILAYTTPIFPERAGLITATGRIVCEPRFDKWGCWMGQGKLSVARLENGSHVWGFVDAEANWIVTPKYSNAQAFSEGLALVEVQKNGIRLWGAIDTAGSTVFEPCYTYIRPFQCGLALCFDGKSSGFVDMSGKIAIECKYRSAEDFRDGTAIVGSENDGRFVIDKTGTQISPPGVLFEGRVPNGYLAWVPSEDGRTRHFGVMDAKWNWAIPAQFDEISTYSNCYPLVARKGGMPCYLKADGSIISMEDQRTLLTNFTAGLAFVMVPGKGCYVIDETGKKLFDWPFEMNGFAPARVPR